MEKIETTSVCKLNQYLEQERDPEVKIRLIALNLVGMFEMSVGEAAEATMVPVGTISDWIRTWNNEGYGGIKQKPMSAPDCAELEWEDLVACSYLHVT